MAPIEDPNPAVSGKGFQHLRLAGVEVDTGLMAREAAQRSDLILFVTDSDLNDTEHTALVQLAAFHKPLIVVLNKIDLYSRDQRDKLLDVIRNSRLKDIVPAEHIVTAAADPGIPPRRGPVRC